MNKSIVDRKFVKSFGAIAPHEFDGLDTLYPDLFERTAEAVTARFAGRAIPDAKTDEVRTHIASLIVVEFLKRLGTKWADTEFVAQENARAAEDWLANSTPLTTARASAPPSEGAVKGQ